MRAWMGIAIASAMMTGSPATAQRTLDSEAEILAAATCQGDGWWNLGFYDYDECYAAYLVFLGQNPPAGSEGPYGWVTLPGGKVCRSVGSGPIYGC